MKNIVLIALFIVGVTSDKAEVSSESTHLAQATLSLTTNVHINDSRKPQARRISTSLKTQLENRATPNRRDGVSYSTSVIHRDPNHPEQEAASSIDFRLNTDDKSAELDQHAAYTTPKSDFDSLQAAHSPEYSPLQSEDVRHAHAAPESEDVIYGRNSGQATSSFHFEQGHHSLQPVTASGNVPDASRPNTHDNHNHPNHHTFYKQLYAQPVYTKTMHKIEVQHPSGPYKHTNSGGRVLSTPRPKTTQVYRPSRVNFASHGSHSQQAHHKSPAPQAYTQAIYHKPEPGKPGTSIGANLQHHGNQNDASGQTQSFNVGYSVKFGNDQGSQSGLRKKPGNAPAMRPESDIITGSYKEEVSRPAHLSHIGNHRFPAPSGHQDDQKFFSTQTILSPKAEKQLAFLENIQSHKFVQKETPQGNFPWKNLSPSVEIYKSKEISLPGSNTASKNVAFDHHKAIGKSEGFDYANAVDFGTGNVIKGQHPIVGLLGHDTQQLQLQAQLAVQPQTAALIAPAKQQQYLQLSDSGAQGIPSDNLPALPKLPIDTSLLREPFVTVHKNRMQAHGAQLPIHFDTTLIKDIGHTYGQIYSNEGHSVALASTPSFQDNLSQINNLLAEQSQQHHNYRQLVSSVPTQSDVDAAGLSNLEQSTSNLIVRQSPTLSPHLEGHAVPVGQSTGNQDDMSFIYPQNGLLNPIMTMMSKPTDTALMTPVHNPQGNSKGVDPQLLKHLKMYKVKEQVPDYAQPQVVKYKVFGKPGNAFMRHQYEKVRHVYPIRVQNSQMQSSPSSKRLVRDYANIEMDLRPPPVAMPFKSANSNFGRMKQ